MITIQFIDSCVKLLTLEKYGYFCTWFVYDSFQNMFVTRNGENGYDGEYGGPGQAVRFKND